MSNTLPDNERRPNDALASLKIDRSADTNRSSRGKWTLLLLLSVVAIAAGAWWIRGKSEPSSGDKGWVPEIMQNRIEVRLARVTVQQGRTADAVVVATGYLESRRQARIGARAAGRIHLINFEEGDRVKQGEVLAELEHRDLDASLSAAEATVKRAKASLAEQKVAIEQASVNQERAKRLRKSNAVSASNYDDARFAYQAAVARRDSLIADIALAEAQVRQSAELRENMFIRAPFDGTVISKDAEVGESILPGGMGGGSGRGSVATVADLDHLEIEVDVQEDFISRVVEQQETEIAVDAVQAKRYLGRVRKIIPMGDRARATIKVKVQILDADELLFPEMAGTVYFLPQESNAAATDRPRFFCPASAVTENDGQQFLWIVDDQDRAASVEVKTGALRDGRFELVQGVDGTEQVIVDPSKLSVGTPVVRVN